MVSRSGNPREQEDGGEREADEEAVFEQTRGPQISRMPWSDSDSDSDSGWGGWDFVEAGAVTLMGR